MSTRNPILLTEYVRQAMRRNVVTPFLNSSNELPAYLLDSQLEDKVAAAITHGEQTSHINLGPEALQGVLNAIQRIAGSPQTPTAILSSSSIRFFMHQIAESAFRNVFFLSHNEIPPNVRVVSLGVIR